MMALPLRQSTSRIVLVGPFVDLSDGVTPETGISLGSVTSAKIIKAAAGAGVSVVSNTWAHVSDGLYNLTLASGDTDTLGALKVVVSYPSTARGPVTADFVVLPAAVYDSLIAGTDSLQADVVQVDGSATAAQNVSKAALTMTPFVVGVGSSPTVINTDLTEGTDDHYVGRTVAFLTGALAGQAGPCTDYNGSTKALTVETMTEAPGSGDLAIIY